MILSVVSVGRMTFQTAISVVVTKSENRSEHLST
jgi:hypothetical protein